MGPERYRLISASHSSTGSPSGLSNDYLGLYARESVCDEYQTFTVNSASVAMVYGENSDYESASENGRSKPLGGDRFFS